MNHVFDILAMIGGLCMFLFGMDAMGNGLERAAGNGLRSLLGKLTTGKFIGFLTGVGVTAIIQSSSATTVMVVGFVNSGLMTLSQAINVIMGANVGTTVTAWLLSLSGIGDSSFLVQMFKPTSFAPILAVVGVVLYLFLKKGKKRDIGLVLLGFTTLIFGMNIMSESVAFLEDMAWFRNLFIAFENPILGLLAGAFLTALIQSSSASVGILQALTVTGAISYGAAVPIIMGQNIGTCVTALISSFGANKNAKRAAMVHLSFNIIGSVVWLGIFSLLTGIWSFPLVGEAASPFGIAVVHSIFNVLCTLLLLPATKLLEKLAHKLVPDAKTPEKTVELDPRLLETPAAALERCYSLMNEMAEDAARSIHEGLVAIRNYTDKTAEEVRELEDRTDHLEDILGTYLVQLSERRPGAVESQEAAKLLHLIGDFERISDHSVNLVESAEELKSKEISLSESAVADLDVLSAAIGEILNLTCTCFRENDISSAAAIEALEEVVDDLKEQMRARHIARLQKGGCTIDAGFIWSDILTNIERVADHCSNIAGCVTDLAANNLNLHASQRTMRAEDHSFETLYASYSEKYSLAAEI